MPTYTETTEQIYRLLPAHHRRADAAQPGPLDQPFKRYLSTIGDQLHALVELVRRLAYTQTDGRVGSDLADPDRAEPSWLPWLAQFVGLEVGHLPTTAERRAALRSYRPDAGSLAALRRVLDEYVRAGGSYTIVEHDNDPWTIGVQIAGIDNLSYEGLAGLHLTYGDVAATYSTYDDFPGAMTELRRTLDEVRPAGFVVAVTLA